MRAQEYTHQDLQYKLSYEDDLETAEILMRSYGALCGKEARNVYPESFIVGLLQVDGFRVHIMPLGEPWFGTIVVFGPKADVDESLRLAGVQSIIQS